VLRTKAGRSSGSLRLLVERDRDGVLALCDRDPVTNVFVAARVMTSGLDPVSLGAQVWGYYESGRLTSACYVGANMVPVEAGPAATAAFADRARLQGRRCSSIAGPTDAVRELWRQLAPYWDRPREIRHNQPLLAISGAPLVSPDPLVRQVRMDEISVLLPASIAMFTEEVGVSPLGADGGHGYRQRIAELIGAGRAFAWIENGEVVFKAEIGAVARDVCQIQGVWVNPRYRGRRVSEGGMSAVVEYALRDFSPVVSLYVNDFNAPARAAYHRVGFREVSEFASVLF
jgi:hypothetical protein